MHLTEQEIQRIASRQPPEPRDAAVRAHLDTCPTCAAALSRAADAFGRDARILASLDVPVPQLTADALIARVRPSARHRAAPVVRKWVWTGIGGLIAAGVAGVMVGAPVQRLLLRTLDGWRKVPPAQQSASSDTGVSAVVLPPQPGRGVGFVAGSRVVVDFAVAQASGVVRVTFAPAARATLTERGGAATFVVTTDGVRVDNQSETASFDLELPASVQHAEIRVADAVVLRKSGDRIVTRAPRDSAGAYLVTLSEAQPGPTTRKSAPRP